MLDARIAPHGPANYTLPLELPSLPNRREHWATRARRARKHRAAALVVRQHPLPCAVRIIRIGPRRLDDDNLVASAKHLRDGIADRLGVDDADSRVVWEYAQEIGPYAVRIEIYPRQISDNS